MKLSKLCNLTKKAIEYYVQQELVFPCILENGYRDFSQNDIEILKEIALYRKLGLRVYEIKGILENQFGLKSFLYKRSIDMEKEKVKQDILNRLCDGEEIKNLEEEIKQYKSKFINYKKTAQLISKLFW